MIYLDNAATTGRKPDTVIRAVKQALETMSANPGRSGHRASAASAEAIYRVREKAAEFFGASGAEQVAFTANCTHSINFVLKGILKPGDHVIVSSMEHNAVMRPLVALGINYDCAEVSLTDDSVTVDHFRALIRPNTRMILCTGASNVIGKRLPLRELGMLCKSHGLFFAVDAAQIAGVVPINMKRDGIDFLCVAPHKGLYAPMGTGILIAEKPLPATVIEGGTGTDSLLMTQPTTMPERMESGTVNLPGIMGISAGIDFVKQRGTERIDRYEMRLIRRLYDGMCGIPRVLLYTPVPTSGTWAPVLSFNIEGITSGAVSEQLNRRGIAVRAGLHCAPEAHRRIGTLPDGTVRLSPSVFNTESEMNAVLSAIREIARK